MKELNFIFLLVVICFISTVLLAISFFCCNQRTGHRHRHNIVNINHQSIDSGFGKLYQFFETGLLPISFSIINLFFSFRRNIAKIGALSAMSYLRIVTRTTSKSMPVTSSRKKMKKKMRKKISRPRILPLIL